MTIALKANAAGTQGEILLNGNPVAEFLANAVNFPGLAQSLTPNGYVKLPGGLIIQWGVVSVTSAIGAKSFPINFPNGALTVQLSPISTLGTTTANPSGLTASGFNAISNVNVNAFFIAIGY